MTTIVVVVIDIYLYDYNYFNSHSEMAHGPLPSGPAVSCATVVVVSREGVLAGYRLTSFS